MQDYNKSSFLLPLFNYLQQYHILSQGFIEAHEKHCLKIAVKKNKYILSSVDKNDCMFFIINGIVRGLVKHKNKDITTWFSFGNEIVGAVSHPIEQSIYSIEHLQALEDCEIICIPNTLITSTYTSYPEANLIGRKMLASQYNAACERSILARIPKASDRYNYLMKKNSAKLSRIPLRYVASYLSIRLETLSRIRTSEIQQKERNIAAHLLEFNEYSFS